jgi:hypothetical protein
MKAISKILVSLVCAAAFVFAASQASANLLINGDFETGAVAPWLVFGAVPPTTQVTVGPPNSAFLPAGSFSADMLNAPPAGAPLGLTLKQSTAAGSVGAGVPMTFSFDFKLNNAALGGIFTYQIFNEKAGGGVINLQFNPGPLFPPVGVWQHVTGNWVTPALTDFVTIQFLANVGATVGSAIDVNVDNVNIIPEPSTVGLVGLGLLGLLGLRRRNA